MSKLKRYHYSGPVYFNGSKIAEFSNIFTTAKSFQAARKNFRFTVANGDYIYYYNIIDDFITEVNETHIHKTCENCGTLLNDMGQCPVCVQGEEDI